MTKTIIAATFIALTAACGGGGGDADQAVAAPDGPAAAADHDEAVPTPAAEENLDHEHDGTEGEHAH